MSFFSTKPISEKIAESTIECFKVVKAHESGKITSVYFPSCTYNINEQTPLIELVKDETPSPYRLTIKEGYHSYNPQKVKYENKGEGFYKVKVWRTSLDGNDWTLEAMADPSLLVGNGDPYKYKIMKCIIPMGSRYYESEDGCMVSNTITPIDLID